MAVEVRLSRRAQGQLSDLLSMIAWDSPAGARRVEVAIGATLDRISEFPESCPSAQSDPELRLGLAARRVHILYRMRPDHVLVTDIVYAGFDLRRLFEQ